MKYWFPPVVLLFLAGLFYLFNSQIDDKSLVLDLMTTVIITLTLVFALFTYLAQSRQLQEEKGHHLRLEKDKLTQQYLTEWSLLEDNNHSRDAFIDKMVFLSENQKDRVDFELIKKFVNSKVYFNDSLFENYSLELIGLDNNTSLAPEHIEVIKGTLNSRLEFLKRA